MKKLVAILLALALIFAMSTTVMADEPAQPETYELTVNGILGHTYKVFQIFTGKVTEEDDGTLVLTDVKYGQNHYPALGAAGEQVPDTKLQDFLNSSDQPGYFRDQITGTAYATINADRNKASETITVDAGYYLIVDVTAEDVLTDGQTLSQTMLKIAETTTITSKHATISSEKKVDDKNDSTTDEDGVYWKDSADYDLGDKVPFQLSVTLPATMNSYATYPLTFHDKQAAGFGAPEITNVYIQRGTGENATVLINNITTAYYTLHNNCTKTDTCEFNGCSFNVAVADVKAIYADNNKTFVDGDKLVIEYKSELLDSEDTVIGAAGNENGMYVCHPDGHTPRDYVTVLTYQLTVNKVDGSNNNAPLAGAGFTLYKWIAEAKDGAGDWVKIGDELKADGMTAFTWSGIDGGKYKLEESTTPKGYNSIADLEFVVDSTHKDEWFYGGNTAFEDLIAKDPLGTKIIFADNDGTIEDGLLEGDVVNHKGVELPETGAEGTMFLIGGGAMLVVVAAVFLVTRKKMSIYED